MYSLAVRFSRSFISQNGLFSFAVTRLRFSNLSFTKLNSILDVQVHRMNLGPRELTDAVDLLSHFNLQQHYAFFFFFARGNNPACQFPTATTFTMRLATQKSEKGCRRDAASSTYSRYTSLKRVKCPDTNF